MCLHHPVGYKAALSTVKEKKPATRQRILHKKNVGAHLTSPPAHKNRVYTCSPHLRRPLVIIVPFWRVWWASVHCRSPRSWLLLSPRAQRYFLTFRHDVLPLSDALGLSDNENLFTVLVSIHPHQIFTGLPVLVMNSQHLFADSLTSTLLDWLG